MPKPPHDLPVGRPPKAAADVASEVLRVRMTPDEYARIELLASQEGQTPASLGRLALRTYCEWSLRIEARRCQFVAPD